MKIRSATLAAAVLAIVLAVVFLVSRGAGRSPQARTEEPVASPVDRSGQASAPPRADPAPRTTETPAEPHEGQPPADPAPETGPAKAPPEKGRECVMASADINGDERPDLVVFERAEAKVVQVLLATEEGDFVDGAEDKVPPYLAKFLAHAAEEGPTDGSVLLEDEAGNEHEVLLWGADER